MLKILDEAKKLQEDIVSFRRHIHQNPELSNELPNTIKYVIEQLNNMGYQPKVICKSGILATVGGKKEGKVILLRADMDALPIQEETDEPFKSVNGAMHACGHDMHTSMLLGAAKLLKAHEDEIHGTVKLMFQPGEETLLGAISMVNAGILENPTVDMTMMLHVATGLPIPPGIFLLPSSGSLTATSDGFKIIVNGKGGHGAMPEMTIDPLITASNIHLSLQSILSREFSASDAVVVTVGKYSGGKAPNIIPDTAEMQGTVRTFDNKHREYVKNRIIEISKGISKAYRCSCDVSFFNGCPSVFVPKKGSEEFAQIMNSIFDSNTLIPTSALNPSGKIMGSEDFAFVTEKVPGIMSVITAGDSRDGFIYPQHHPKARFVENVMYRGSAAYAGFAIKWLEQNK